VPRVLALGTRVLRLLSSGPSVSTSLSLPHPRPHSGMDHCRCDAVAGYDKESDLSRNRATPRQPLRGRCVRRRNSHRISPPGPGAAIVRCTQRLHAHRLDWPRPGCLRAAIPLLRNGRRGRRSSGPGTSALRHWSREFETFARAKAVEQRSARAGAVLAGPLNTGILRHGRRWAPVPKLISTSRRSPWRAGGRCAAGDYARGRRRRQ